MYIPYSTNKLCKYILVYIINIHFCESFSILRHFFPVPWLIGLWGWCKLSRRYPFRPDDDDDVPYAESRGDKSEINDGGTVSYVPIRKIIILYANSYYIHYMRDQDCTRLWRRDARVLIFSLRPAAAIGRSGNSGWAGGDAMGRRQESYYMTAHG